MKKRYNSDLTIGLLFNAMFLLSNIVNVVPDLIKGLLAGIGFGLMAIGIYEENHDISKFKDRKKQLIKSIFNR